MCDFFSFRTDGAGNPYYLNAEQRKEVLAKDENPDSHTFIAEYYGFKDEDEDMLNAYEHNPLTKELTIIRMNNKDDSVQARAFCEHLDYKTVVPELVIKPIVHPFTIEHGVITETDIERLKQWISVRNSMRDSVWDSVRKSVKSFVGDSVWASLWNPIRSSVGVSVWNRLWASLKNPVRGTVGGSVGDSIAAYVSSFFNFPKWNNIGHREGINPFQCAVDMWESGLVPSFDGDTWRLHGGKNAEIMYELKGKA